MGERQTEDLEVLGSIPGFGIAIVLDFARHQKRVEREAISTAIKVSEGQNEGHRKRFESEARSTAIKVCKGQNEACLTSILVGPSGAVMSFLSLGRSIAGPCRCGEFVLYTCHYEHPGVWPPPTIFTYGRV